MKKQLLLAILLLALSVVSASAQGSLEQAAKNARDQFFDIKNRSIELERMKREANKRPANANSAHGFPEIKEDFEQIQKINSDFLQPTIIKTPVVRANCRRFPSANIHPGMETYTKNLTEFFSQLNFRIRD